MATQEAAINLYVQTIGSNEPDYSGIIKGMRPDHPFYSSMLIGHGCMLLATNPAEKAEQRADSYFRRADDILERRLRETSTPWEEGPLSLVQHTARTLLCRDSPDLLAFLSADLRERTIDTIAWLRSEMDDPQAAKSYGRLLVGTFAQQVALGLYARIKDSNILPAMALTHHDCGPKRTQNYDLLAVYTGNKKSKKPPRTSKLQIKARCLDLDPDHHSSSPSSRRYVRSQSATDIILVSGCCDMNMRTTGPNLVAELDAQQGGETVFTAKQRRGLNYTSNHMQRIAIGKDTWNRSGTAQVRSISITQRYADVMEQLARQDANTTD